MLFFEAKRQAMTGVLFRAIERVPKEQRPATSLKLQWYIAKERIEHRNILLNRQCIAVMQRLEADGMRPCLLKGPGIATLCIVCREI